MSNDNTGTDNSGNYNPGHYNPGHYNSGHYNSGHYNSGDYNSGHRNSGHRNSGDYNSGGRNSGDCNTNQPKVRLFNHDSGWDFFGGNHNRFRAIISQGQKPLCEWIITDNMSIDEKEKHPSHETTGGYLKVNEKTFNGEDLTKDEEKFLRSVPNFDAEILLECTGIDITNRKKKIVIDGKEIMISKESFEEIKKQFME